ncbi:Acetyl-coenzyme A synthetase [Chlamydiales bacterium STE3]|nr:Acetyl-coenzyme A synthetase [Chlamydiales bacterium STE3]
MDQDTKSLFNESQIIIPSEDFITQANVQSQALHQSAKEDPEAFWAKMAEKLSWFKPWDKVLEWKPPFAEWFIGGKLNACYNCVDRHLLTDKKEKTALIWEGEPGDCKTLTYQELYEEVCKFANCLKKLGVGKGDRVALYLPLIPEAVIAILAIARIGAIHTVVFGGFSSSALEERMQDAEARLLITADGGYRRGSIIPLKSMADVALRKTPLIEHVVVVQRTCQLVTMQPGRDVWYHEMMAEATSDCEPEWMDAEDPLYILYTSGTTGKPKGILHTTGGYLLGAHTTMEWVFDVKPKDVYWCTADIGWVTGHTYVVYGPLSNGMTEVIYEGGPDWPDRSRFWSLIEKYSVTIFYTAPTAIRTFMKWGRELPQKHNLSSLRLLGSVGEPINPEAWMWYYENIGRSCCPIVDTWWQTETGSILIAPLPGITPLKPGSATLPLPGIEAVILNDQGEEVDTGYLAIKSPWPSMLRGLYKDPERYVQTYWKKWHGQYYFAGDGAYKDSEGFFWLLGRVDDVLNVSGHRIGTMEIESALVDYHLVAEAAVVGIADEIKGEAIIAFVILKERAGCPELLETALTEHVINKIGSLARPKKIYFTRDLPKTRSGKIMRRLLRDIGEGRVLGDITTLADISIIEDLKQQYEED